MQLEKNPCAPLGGNDPNKNFEYYVTDDEGKRRAITKEEYEKLVAEMADLEVEVPAEPEETEETEETEEEEEEEEE